MNNNQSIELSNVLYDYWLKPLILFARQFNYTNDWVEFATLIDTKRNQICNPSDAGGMAVAIEGLMFIADAWQQISPSITNDLSEYLNFFPEREIKVIGYTHTPEKSSAVSEIELAVAVYPDRELNGIASLKQKGEMRKLIQGAMNRVTPKKYRKWSLGGYYFNFSQFPDIKNIDNATDLEILQDMDLVAYCITSFLLGQKTHPIGMAYPRTMDISFEVKGIYSNTYIDRIRQRLNKYPERITSEFRELQNSIEAMPEFRTIWVYLMKRENLPLISADVVSAQERLEKFGHNENIQIVYVHEKCRGYADWLNPHMYEFDPAWLNGLNVKWMTGGYPHEFQLQGISYLMSVGCRGAITHEMGLGKTVQACIALHAIGGLPLLVVCPLAAFSSWARTWLLLKGDDFQDKISILEDGQDYDEEHRKPFMKLGKWRIPINKTRGVQVYIIGYDRAAIHLPKICKLEYKSIVFDEAHRLKNYKYDGSMLSVIGSQGQTIGGNFIYPDDLVKLSCYNLRETIDAHVEAMQQSNWYENTLEAIEHEAPDAINFTRYMMRPNIENQKHAIFFKDFGQLSPHWDFSLLVRGLPSIVDLMPNLLDDKELLHRINHVRNDPTLRWMTTFMAFMSVAEDDKLSIVEEMEHALLENTGIDIENETIAEDAPLLTRLKAEHAQYIPYLPDMLGKLKQYRWSLFDQVIRNDPTIADRIGREVIQAMWRLVNPSKPSITQADYTLAQSATRRIKGAFALSQQAKHVVLISGTLAVNIPEEILSSLGLIDAGMIGVKERRAGELLSGSSNTGSTLLAKVGEISHYLNFAGSWGISPIGSKKRREDHKTKDRVKDVAKIVHEQISTGQKAMKVLDAHGNTHRSSLITGPLIHGKTLDTAGVEICYKERNIVQVNLSQAGQQYYNNLQTYLLSMLKQGKENEREITRLENTIYDLESELEELQDLLDEGDETQAEFDILHSMEQINKDIEKHSADLVQRKSKADLSGEVLETEDELYRKQRILDEFIRERESIIENDEKIPPTLHQEIEKLEQEVDEIAEQKYEKKREQLGKGAMLAVLNTTLLELGKLKAKGTAEHIKKIFDMEKEGAIVSKYRGIPQDTPSHHVRILVLFWHKVTKNAIIQQIEKFKAIDPDSVFHNMRYSVIDGATNKKERIRIEEDFNHGQDGYMSEEWKDRPLRLLFGSVKTMESVSFPMGTHAIFAELDWTPAAILQAEKRIHRLNTPHDVRIDIMIAKDTIDEWVWGKVYEKIMLTQLLLTGTVPDELEWRPKSVKEVQDALAKTETNWAMDLYNHLEAMQPHLSKEALDYLKLGSADKPESEAQAEDMAGAATRREANPTRYKTREDWMLEEDLIHILRPSPPSRRGRK
jgi:hypothetical protein